MLCLQSHLQKQNASTVCLQEFPSTHKELLLFSLSQKNLLGNWQKLTGEKKHVHVTTYALSDAIRDVAHTGYEQVFAGLSLGLGGLF